MPTTTTNQALPVPVQTDDPNIVDDLTTLATAIEKKLVMVFNNVADRSTRVAAPTEGMYAYMKDTDSFVFYNGVAWASALGGVPSFTSGASVPANSVGSNGDVFFKI